MPNRSILKLNKISKIIHENNKKKGFYVRKKNLPEILCLVHSEISEAVDADRKGVWAKSRISKTHKKIKNHNFSEIYKNEIKGCVEEEIADTIIRLLDLCGYYKIDIEKHITCKLVYNKTRPYLHGKKYG